MPAPGTDAGIEVWFRADVEVEIQLILTEGDTAPVWVETIRAIGDCDLSQVSFASWGSTDISVEDFVLVWIPTE